MFFKQNTLSESDTIKIVTNIALVSLRRHYEGGNLLTAGQRNEAATELIRKVLGDCSKLHKAKLMAFVDTMVKTILSQPVLNEYYSTQLIKDSQAIAEAKKEMFILAFNGLLQNGIIAGHTASEWTGSDRVNGIADELEKAMDASLEQIAEDIYQAILPQFKQHSINSDIMPSEIFLGYLLGYTDGVLQNLNIMDDESLVELSNLVIAKFFKVKIAMKIAQITPTIKANITPDLRLGLRAGIGDADAKFQEPEYRMRNLTDLAEAGHKV